MEGKVKPTGNGAQCHTVAERPLLAGFFLTNILFLGIHFRRILSAGLSALILFTILILDVVIISATLCLVFTRSARSSADIASIALLLASMIVAVSVAFPSCSVFASIPLIRWTTVGILAAQRSDLLIAAANGGILLLIAGISLLAVKRFG